MVKKIEIPKTLEEIETRIKQIETIFAGAVEAPRGFFQKLSTELGILDQEVRKLSPQPQLICVPN